MEAPHEIWFQSVSGFLKQKFENVESEWSWTKINDWPWPLIFIKLHVLIWLTASTYFDIMDYNSFWKSTVLPFTPYKSIWDQIWPCHKIGQGHSSVIIWTNLTVLEHPMLHTKFQGNRHFGSREGFLMFLSYMVMEAIFVMWPGPFEQTLVPPSHRSSIWNLTDWPSGFCRE